MTYWIYEESDGNGQVNIKTWDEAQTEQEARELLASEGYVEFSDPYRAGGYDDNPVIRSRDGVIYPLDEGIDPNEYCFGS